MVCPFSLCFLLVSSLSTHHSTCCKKWLVPPWGLVLLKGRSFSPLSPSTFPGSVVLSLLSSLPHKIKHLETTVIVSCFYISLSINVLVLFFQRKPFLKGSKQAIFTGDLKVNHLKSPRTTQTRIMGHNSPFWGKTALIFPLLCDNMVT